MKDLEKIEEAAINIVESKTSEEIAESFRNKYDVSFTTSYDMQYTINGAKSKAAKEFWQQGMYSEEEVRQLFIDRAEEFSPQNTVFGDFLLKQDLKWFEEHKKK